MSLASIFIIVLLLGALIGATLKLWWVILAAALLLATGPETLSWLMTIPLAWLFHRCLFPSTQEPPGEVTWQGGAAHERGQCPGTPRESPVPWTAGEGTRSDQSAPIMPRHDRFLRDAVRRRIPLTLLVCAILSHPALVLEGFFRSGTVALIVATDGFFHPARIAERAENVEHPRTPSVGERLRPAVFDDTPIAQELQKYRERAASVDPLSRREIVARVASGYFSRIRIRDSADALNVVWGTSMGFIAR